MRGTCGGLLSTPARVGAGSLIVLVIKSNLLLAASNASALAFTRSTPFMAQTIFGSKLELRSRATSIGNRPNSPLSVFELFPFLELPVLFG
jgi:hypothetical protein